jgi:hypothetical protein
MSRLDDVKKFYQIMSKLEKKIGGKKQFGKLSDFENLPEKGIYFLFEKGELRSTSGRGLRIVRVGAQAIMPFSRSSMQNRLLSHRGNDEDLGGKHRRSVLRKLIGRAVMKRDKISIPTWEKRVQPHPKEKQVEEKISKYVRDNFKFLYLDVDSDPESWRMRKYFKKNLLSLLGNFKKEEFIDPPSKKWLGNQLSGKDEKVAASGLWNAMHVKRKYEPEFLDKLEKYVNAMKAVKK